MAGKRKGPKPQPDEVRNFKGDPGKRANPSTPEDKVPVSGAAPPPHLVDKARELWAEIAPHLIQAKLLRDSDRALLALLCDQMAHYWEMSAKVRLEGHAIDVTTYAGTDRATQIKRAHPLLKSMKDTLGTIKDLADRIPISPVARTQLMAAMAGRYVAPPPAATGSQASLPGTEQPAGSPDDPLNFLPDGPPN